MGTQATLIYRVVALGISSTRLQPFVATTPIPADVLQALGLRIISDSTTIPATNPIVRTIILGFEPSAPATLAAPLTISNTGRIDAVSLNAGLDYILPPIVRANNNARSQPLTQIVQGNTIDKRPVNVDAILKSYMDVRGFTVAVPGVGYTAPVATFLGGLPPANFNFDFRKVDPTATVIPGVPPRNFRGGCVRYINIADPGEGYDPTTVQLNIQGGGPNGNTPAIPAKGILVLDARGRVKSITITDMGSGYVSVPQVVLTTTTGIASRKQAKLYAVMAEGRPARATAQFDINNPHGITGLTITDHGDNYVTVPDILITDPTGSGAVVIARMGVGRVDVINPGRDYLAGTSVSITPFFEDLFPVDPLNAQAQGVAFFQFLQTAIGQNAITPLTSDVPLVA